MKNILLLTGLFLSLILASCTKNIPTCESCAFDCIENFDNSIISSSDCPNNYECAFELIPDSKVDHDNNEGISSSNSSFIIKFSSSTEGSPEIADDEFFISFLLEVPYSNDSFEVSGEKVKDLNASVKRSCFCPFVDWKLFDNGCIQGEKIDGTWYVQGNVSVDYYDNNDPLEYKFDFKVQ